MWGCVTVCLRTFLPRAPGARRRRRHTCRARGAVRGHVWLGRVQRAATYRPTLPASWLSRKGLPSTCVRRGVWRGVWACGVWRHRMRPAHGGGGQSRRHIATDTAPPASTTHRSDAIALCAQRIVGWRAALCKCARADAGCRAPKAGTPWQRRATDTAGLYPARRAATSPQGTGGPRTLVAAILKMRLEASMLAVLLCGADCCPAPGGAGRTQ